MKKALSLILTAVMLVSIFSSVPVVAQADSIPPSGQCGENAYFTFDAETGTLTISGSGPMWFYGYSPTGDYDPYPDYTWHSGDILALVIENGITKITKQAFEMYFTNLASVVIADSVTEIDAFAFSYCYALTDVTIGTGVTRIADGAFYACKSLAHINYAGTQQQWDAIDIAPQNNDYLFALKPQNGTVTGSCGENAYYTLDKATGVLNITGSGAMEDYNSPELSDDGLSPFYENAWVKTVNIASGITKIGTQTFRYCRQLTQVNIPNTVKTIAHSAFKLCVKLPSITIPNGVTTIPQSCFANCDNLRSVTIPVSVTKIEMYAFHDCYEIEEVNYAGTREQWEAIDIEDHNFCLSAAKPPLSGECGDHVYYTLDTETGVLTISGSGYTANYLQSGYSPFYYNKIVKKIVIENGVKNIGDRLFENMPNVESISIPQSVESLGMYAFNSCVSLKSITIPRSVTSISKCVFGKCLALSSITVESGNTVYDSRGGCNAVIETDTNTLVAGCKDTVIPSTVTVIGEAAFFVCETLSGITIPNGVTKIGASAFYKCTGLTSMTLPNGVTEIGQYAFDGASALESINFPDSLTKIGYSAFYDCKSLRNITIPDSVTQIGNFAFYNCEALTSITIPGSVEAINYGTFKYCDNLKKATLLNGVKTISEGSFEGCNALASVYLPKTLTTIEDYSFLNNQGLQYVYFLGSPEERNFSIDYSKNKPLQAAEWRYLEGSCGENASYRFDPETNTLFISGSGAMATYSTTGSPFYCQDFIEHIVIEEGITRVGDFTFVGCTGVLDVIVPQSLTTVYRGAFRDCSQLSDVYYIGTQTQWESVAIQNPNDPLLNAAKHFDCSRGFCGEDVRYFFNGTTLTLSGTGAMYDFHESGDSPFYGESAIKQIIIGGGITRIGNNAFRYCTGLTDVTIPTTVTSIGERAFIGCSKLAEVNYTGTQDEWDDIAIGTGNGLLTNVKPQMLKGPCGNYARYSYNPKTGVLTITGTSEFGGCTMYDYSVGTAPWYENHVFITAVVMDDRISAIGANAFADCMNMTSVTIGRRVSTIGDGAFNGCDRLATVNYARTQADWDDITIGENNTPLTKIKPQYGGKCGTNATYHFDPASGTLTISGSGAMEDYGSDYPGYYGLRDSITAIQINEGITRIGNLAFYNLQNAESVTIPTTVTAIGRSAFQYCYGLLDVYYAGAGMEWDNINIGAVNNALEDATMHFGKENILTGECGEHAYFSLNLDTNTLTISGSGAMYDYEYAPWDDYKYDIFTIVVESGITAIGNRAFEDCAVNDVSIANTVTAIGKYALSSCDSLSAVEIPSSVAYIGEGAFTYCTDLTSVEIPAGITGIEKFTFMNCTALQSITIPASVSRIDEYAFDGCTALETVNFTGTGEQWDDMPIGAYNEPLLAVKPQCCGTCGANLTYRLDHITGTLYIEGTGAMDNFTSTSMPWYAFKEKILKVNVANGVTTIGENAFWNCKTIEDVTLGNTVQKIGKYAFGGCESLESVNLPNSLTSIGGQAFGNCVSLESIAIPSGVTSLATSTFASCTALKTITLPTTLTKIGAAAFSRCFGLQTVGYAGTQEDWNAVEILDSNDPLLAVKPQTGDVIRTGTCGENVTYILNETTGLLTISGTGAMYDYELIGNASPFNNNPKIKEIVVESGVTNIGNDAFTQLTKLEKVSLPSTVTSLGKDAFAFCFLLADINIPESVQSIGKEAFSACYALTSITIPKGVKTIGKSTFWYCDHLQSVTLPKSLESVDDNAFVYCSALTDVFYEGTASDWNAVTISSSGNDPLLGATMHYGATDFAAIRYKVPAFAGTSTTLTFKSDTMTITVSAADGNFEKDNVQSGVYKVYAKQKNALTIYLGKYDTASGAVTNTGAITLPLGDVNSDDVIDFADTSRLLSAANYGKYNANMDLTGDGMITVADISTALLAGNYGMSSVKVV